jgi:cysteine desulfurase/selenocysteine lyase
MPAVSRHETELTAYALDRLREIEDLAIYGPATAAQRTGVISFNIVNVHPHDLSTFLDLRGVAIRAGHHCAQPLIERLGQESTARMSLYLYNNREDIDTCIDGLKAARRFFAHGAS